jgi:ribonuclease BN (tRNA processing enzyme)
MELTFLGTGAAFAPDAYNAGYILDRRVLLDAGAPAHVHLHRTGHDLAAMEAAVITHQHADHTFGLPFILASRAVRRISGDFAVVGPPGFTEYSNSLLRLAWGDVLYDIVMERARPTYVEIHPGEDIEVAGFKLHAEAVVHAPDMPCHGYVFEREGVRFGFSGDSGDCAGLRRLVEMSDYFLCEMTGVDNDPSHLGRGYVSELVRAHPGKRFFLTHLNSRDEVAGASLATDFATVELLPQQQ